MAKTPQHQVVAYARLKKHLQLYSRISVIDFNEQAAAQFIRLKQSKIRVGTMDLKFASITLANNATLLTRNLSDFSKIPDLKVEDWSV